MKNPYGFNIKVFWDNKTTGTFFEEDIFYDLLLCYLLKEMWFCI